MAAIDEICWCGHRYDQHHRTTRRIVCWAKNCWCDDYESNHHD